MQLTAQRPGRILVVDDEHSARLLLERVLTRAGHEVVLAETGTVGLSCLTRERFDIVVLDKNLPDLDGFELLRQAREKLPTLQAVIITAFPSNQSKQLARQDGVAAYLAKPFNITDIVASCDDAIGLVRAAESGRR